MGQAGGPAAVAVAVVAVPLVQDPCLKKNEHKSTVSRVERRLRQEAKKDLPLPKSDLCSKAAKFNFTYVNM